uniref:Uncharacterized protein n=1 Tax=Ditylenchus dipsaci TaxID=166011 RepID=A0A915DG10_9BILA
MTCMSFPGDTTQLDQFRVRQRLNQPSCEMEAVECSVAQDACVTVTMKVGPHRYWVGAGCDQRVNYDYPAHRDGCAKMEVSTRNYQPGWMEEGRANQMVKFRMFFLFDIGRANTFVLWSVATGCNLLKETFAATI